MMPDEPSRWGRLSGPRVLLGVFVALLVAFSAYLYYDKITKPSRDGHLTRSAFLRWRDQILGLESGLDIYQVHNYPNPPIQALILYPFVKLDRIPGAMLWFAAKVVMAGLSIVWVFRLIRGTGPPIPTLGKAAGLLLASHSILGDLSHGNVNIYIAFLVFATLELFRRERPWAAGTVLALAIACKVTPALFVPYFVWKRAWKMVAATVLACGLWLVVVPGVVLGFDYNNTLLTSWFETMVRPFVVEGKVTSEHANQSLPGLTFRMLTNQPSVTTYDEDDGKPRPERFDNFTDIGTSGAKWVVRGFQGLFVLAVVLFCRVRVPQETSTRSLAFAAECSLILLGMLVFSERTWKHHGVVMLLPFCTLGAATYNRTLPKWLNLSVGTIMVLVFLLIALPSAASADAQDLALTYGSHTAVFLLLMLGTLVILWHEGKFVLDR
jgi:alpha-1,2-mannosyltransferase